MAGRLSAEWHNSNLSKAYPLRDRTGGAAGTLPSALLVDGLVLAHNPGIISAYISKLTVDDLGWTLDITVDFQDTEQNTTAVVFASVITVSFESELFSVTPFNVSTNGYTITGSFTIGNADAVRDCPRETILNKDNGELDPAVLHESYEETITGIRVGDAVLVGEIELIAGEGIDLIVDESTNSITITNTKYKISEDIVDDTSLLQRVGELYGTPIKSISGVFPDSEGNIDILVPKNYSESSDFVSVHGVNSEAGVITIGLAKDPCLFLEDITTAADNLKELNTRAARLDAAVSELDTALNKLATQMTRIS